MAETTHLLNATACKKESLRSAYAVSEAKGMGRPVGKICTAHAAMARKFRPEIVQRCPTATEVCDG